MQRNLEEFNLYHRGKPACVIASGPSTAMVDTSLLSSFVTFSVNGGILAYPQSDYFVSDDADAANWTYFFCDLKELQSVVLLYEDKFSNVLNLFGDRRVFFRHRTGYHITDKYEHYEYENRICQCRTSVGSAIHIAHIMGCSPIVLLGVDCRRFNNKRWFWELGKHSRPRRIDGRRADRYRLSKMSDADLDGIADYWARCGQIILEKCKVYNASPISAVEVFERKPLQDCLG